MYCPECGVEYRDGFTECADCRVPLVGGSPPPDPFDPNLELVTLLETNDQIKLAMLKGLLEEAEIPFNVLGRIATLIQDIDPMLHKWVQVQVPRDREAEARELVESLSQEVAPDGEEP